MASTCYTIFRLPRIRATLLDACGATVDSTTSYVSTKGIITVEETREYEDRVEFFQKNGDGDFCINETEPPILKWINLVLTFCKVDPELVNMLTAEPLVLTDAATPSAVGYRTQEGSAASANFAFEGWTRIGGQANCANGTIQYGYALYPWVIEGTIGDITYGNDVANFVVNARTRSSSPWSTGPYNVVISEAVSTTGLPMPLLTAIGSTQHKHMQMTKMAPPADACGGQDITPTLTITNVGLTATVTIPAGATLPVYITWGDAAVSTVTSGTTAAHTYAGAGTKAVTLASKVVSGPTYTGSIAVA